jgi:flagellar hook-associated protein 2
MALTGGISSTQNASVSGLVQQYMQLEMARMNMLQADKQELKVEGRTYTELSTKLSALRNAADRFRWPGALNDINTFTASTSDDALVGATVSGTATDGHHSVEVASLARAHSMVANEFAGADPVDGSWVGEHHFAIEIGGETSEISVSIDADNTTEEALRKVAIAINSSSANVTATAVSTDSRTGIFRIQLSSKSTGTNNIITSVLDTTGSLMSTIGLAGSSAAEGYSANTVQLAGDAEFTVDGLSFVSDTNQVENAISGLTLNLVNASETPTTIMVERDQEEVIEGLQEFIDAYNDVINYVQGETAAADEEGQNRGQFTGDTMFMTLRTNLRSLLTNNVAGITDTENGYQRLSEIGITSGRTGTMSISSKNDLEGALKANPAAVEQLFNLADEGIAVKVEGFANTYVKAGGLIAQRRQMISTQERNVTRQIDQEQVNLEEREQALTDELGNLQMVLSQLNFQSQYSSALSGGGASNGIFI